MKIEELIVFEWFQKKAFAVTQKNGEIEVKDFATNSYMVYVCHSDTFLIQRTVKDLFSEFEKKNLVLL